MQIGVTYPQTDIEADRGAVKQYTQAVEALGFTHVVAYDHVLGANTAARPDWNGPYRLESQFREPFALFSFMAGVSDKLGFMSGVMILSQRQTALVAKQAACVDVLCNGRLRLGVGTGWNDLEYEALGVPFADRGDRFEEQIAVLRGLWTEKAWTYKGRYHSIPDVGLCPLPVQRPIPLWFGGGGSRPIAKVPAAGQKVLRRIARLADGWFPMLSPGSERTLETIEGMRKLVRECGRDPKTFGIEGGIAARRAGADHWTDELKFWERAGVSKITINTMFDGLSGVDQHVQRLEEVAGVLKRD